jgi:putative ABC transport system substrate-binding protein
MLARNWLGQRMHFERLKRREFITLLGGAAAGWPLAGLAQQPTLPVIGFLDAGSAAERADIVAAFRKGLAEAGFVEGQNVAIEFRWADGTFERLAGLAAELVRRPVSVLVAPATSAAVVAAKAATAAIPVVFGVGVDPVGLGLVASLNRPGGNVTGVSFLFSEASAKRMQLLRELVPGAHRVAVLANSTDLSNDSTLRNLQAATAGLEIVVAEAATGREIDLAFARLAREKIDAVFVPASTFFASRRAQLVVLSARYILPAAYSRRSFVEGGGLMSYGPDIDGAIRQVGVYAGRILKGTRPADLPVMQSTKFEFAINLNTANALSLAVPSILLSTADVVIE